MSMVDPEPVLEELHPDRVRLVFRQADGATKEARVPAGTTLDSAWRANDPTETASPKFKIFIKCFAK